MHPLSVNKEDEVKNDRPPTPIMWGRIAPERLIRMLWENNVKKYK